MLLQESEESEPAFPVSVGVGVLVIAAGGVDDDGIVGEPPIAIARSADARDGLRLARTRERKAKPDLTSAVVLPAPGGLMMRYQGRS
jgi:hypothetical protein